MIICSFLAKINKSSFVIVHNPIAVYILFAFGACLLWAILAVLTVSRVRWGATRTHASEYVGVPWDRAVDPSGSEYIF
jgi:hypothetical protein